MPGSRLFYYQDLKQFLRVFLLPPFSPPHLILLDALERKQHFYLFEMETIGFGRATFISPLGNLRDDLIEFHLQRSCYEFKAEEKAKTTFCSDTSRALSALGPLLTALWSADKDNGMTSRTFSGQRKFPVSLFKGSHGPLKSAVLGIGTDFPADGQETECQAEGAVVMKAVQMLGSMSVPNFMWGALAGLEIKKRSLQ